LASYTTGCYRHGVYSDGRTQIATGAFGESRWEMARRRPPAALRPFVRRIVGYDEHSPGPQSQRQFPEPDVTVIIEFGPPLRVALRGDAGVAARYPGGFVAGLGDAFAITEHEGRQRGIQVDLTPTGARRFFGMPMSLLAGRIVALTDLLPVEHRRLAERLEAASDWACRLDLVEAILARGILAGRVDTTRVDWALGRIEATGGTLDVGSLALELGYSHKHLIALFHDQVGVRPKLLARLVRFGRVMGHVRSGAYLPWAEVAAAHGYYDQAHLARDVKHFTGLTPTLARANLSGPADLFG
jgi:AraC-like DNA-binding protein